MICFLIASVAIYRYRPMLAVEFIETELAFPGKKECLDFLKGLGVTLSADESKVDCKASMSAVEST